jgi:activator of HSP90 ATPase
MEKAIVKTYGINAKPSKVWSALVSPALIRKWSGAKAVMRPKIGTRFELWDGYIYGKNIEVIKQKRVVQEWYGGKWAEPSQVIITLTPIAKGTRVRLEQRNVPSYDYDSIKRGWDDYYFGPIKDLLEKNS